MSELHLVGSGLDAFQRKMVPRSFRLKTVLLQILLEAESCRFRTTTDRIHDACLKELATRIRIASSEVRPSAGVPEVLLDVKTEILSGVREMISEGIVDDWLAFRLLFALPGRLPHEA